MAHNISGIGLSKVISQLSGFVNTEAQMFDRAGGKPALESLYEEPNGQRWHKVKDPSIPHLNGKWVNENVIEWLHSHHVTYGWAKAMTDTFQRETGTYDLRVHFKNPLISRVVAAWDATIGRLPAVGLLGKGLTTLGNVLGLSKVLINPPSHIIQWSSNILWNAPMMGLDPFDFFQGPKYWRYLWEGQKSLGRGPDYIWDLIYGNHNAEIQKSSADALLEKALDRNWRSTAGLDARIERARAEFESHSANPDGAELAAKAAERLSVLKNERMAAEARESKVSGIGKAIMHYTKVGGQMLLGRGPAVEFAWDLFGRSDLLTKYAALKYLIEDEGMSQKGALTRIDHFGQNLHRAPESVKLLSQKLGGSKFTTWPFNQLSTIKNAISERPQFLAFQLGKLQAWNRAILARSGQDQDEMVEAWSQSNGYGPAGTVLKNQFLMSRILMPGGSWIDLDPIWGVLTPQSPMARRVNSMILESGLNPVATVGLQAIAGAASKFAGGSIGMNAIGHIMSQKGVRGEPVRDLWDFLRVTYKELTPEWLPPWGRDWEFFTKTPVVDPVTNKPTAGKDVWYYLNRFFKIYNDEKLGSHVRAKAALDSVLKADGTGGKFYGNLSYWDLLEVKVRANGGFNPDGSVNPGKVYEIVQQHHKDLDRTLPGLDPDDPKEAQIKGPDYYVRVAKEIVKPRVVRSFHHANLAQEIEAYVHWRAMDSKPDPTLDQALKGVIINKIMVRQPEAEMQVRILKRQSYYQSLKERLAPDVLPTVLSWIYEATRNKE